MNDPKPYQPGDSPKVQKAKSDLAQARRGKWRGLRENQAGKGDAPRHDLAKFRSGYDAIRWNRRSIDTGAQE